MHYLLCVRLESFYVRELIRQHPELEDQTCVITEDRCVLDASDDAIARGVTYRMPQMQAKALVASARFIERKKDVYKQAQEGWLNALVPYSDVIEPIDQHEALIDLGAHPRPSEMACLATEALSRHTPRVVSGFGGSRWVARLAAEVGRSSELCDDAAFLSSLPVQALALISPEAREKLSLLGYREIGALRKISPQVLCRQFPAEGLLIHRLAHANHFEPIQPLYPDRSIGGLFPFKGGTDSMETLVSGCARLARKLGDRLLNEEQETPDLLLHIEHESRINSFHRCFSKPIRNELSLLAALRLMLEETIDEPVYSVRVTLPHLKRAKRVQNSLFAQRADGDRKLSQAVSSVKAVFGQAAICQGSEIELPRRVRVLKEMGRIVGWI